LALPVEVDPFALPALITTSEPDEEPAPQLSLSQEAKRLYIQRDEARAIFVRAWRKLSQEQRQYLRKLEQHNFSRNKTLGELVGLKRGTVLRWHKLPAFKDAFEALKKSTAEFATSRDELLLRAHRAAEYAEEEQPVLYQGEDTGFRERALGEMIRANEQLMKATKVIGSDAPSAIGTGPALLIQVVQQGGGVIDVTSNGVAVDLPVPDGA
jgi:hypothetical protein